MALTLLKDVFFKLLLMTIDNFQALSLKTQRDVVLNRGIQLAEKQTSDYNSVLYDINGFYAELYYPPESDKVLWVNSFDATDELDFYLQDIDVSALAC